MWIYAYTLLFMKTSRILYVSQSRAFASIVSFALVLITFFSLQAQPVGETFSLTQSAEGRVWIFPQFKFTETAGGIVYESFVSFSVHQQNGLGTVFYGSGETPIGGLQTSYGYLLLLGCVIIYCGWRFCKRRKRIDVSATDFSGTVRLLNDREKVTAKVVKL